MMHEDTLQQYLQELESGTPLQELVGLIPPDDDDLRAELEAAALLLAAEHPVPDLQAKELGKQRLLQQSRPRSQPGWSLSRPNLGWLMPVSAVVLVVAALVLVFALGSGVLVARNITSRTTAVVDHISGGLEISRDGGANWQTLTMDDRVQAGEMLRSGINSSAVLSYSDGSRTIIGPSTTIQVLEIERSLGNVISVHLAQLQGASSHKVIPFDKSASAFLIDTPSGAATVNGTEFSVSVQENGASRFRVDRGAITVAGSTREVLVSAGQTTGLEPGEDPEDPAYQFSLQGKIAQIEAGQWTVSGVVITITADTEILGSPAVDDLVYVEGRILDNQTWVADLVLPVQGEPISTMTGIVDSIGPLSWSINGQTFLINQDTAIDSDIETGYAVKVIFINLEDGQWQALSIRSLEENTEKEPDPEAQPNLSFTPDEIQHSVCAGQSTVLGTLVNTGDEENDVAQGVLLGYEIIQNAGLVERIDLVPDKFELIESGETVQFDLAVEFSGNWQSAAAGTEVKIQVFVADEINHPDLLPERLTVTFVRSCAETVTPEFTSTPQTPPTPTLQPEETPTATEEGEATTCTGANPHPTGLTLAARYSVSYEEIMGWFCQGFGFGEIDLAYGLSLQSGVSVNEIFAMRSSGMGWGAIKQQLDPKGKPDQKKP